MKNNQKDTCAIIFIGINVGEKAKKQYKALRE